MAINWDEVRRKAQERGRANEQYIQSIQRAAAPPSPKVTPSLPKAAPKKNILEEAFDPSENYIDKLKQGNIGGAAANFLGTGLTAAQTLYLNALNAADSLTQGKGLPKYQPMMGFSDYEKSVAERRGKLPVSEQISQVSPALGTAFRVGMEIGTDPLELTPMGFLNNIKLARGTAQNTQAYMAALQSGKLNPAGTTATLPRNARAPIPRVVPRANVQPVRPDFYVNRGGVASPDVSAVQIAGELPAPPRSRIQRGPGARIKPQPTTAQAEGLFVDYYPERRAADVVRSKDFHPITIEAGLDPEELVTVYRGAPAHQKSLNNGDWVTTSEQLAKDYAGGGKIIKDKIKAKYLYAPKGEGIEELIYSTNQKVSRTLPRLQPKPANIYTAAKGQKEAPFTVTPGEVSGEIPVRRLGRGTSRTTVQAQNRPVQPVLPKKGDIPPAGVKSVGADVNLNKPKMKVSKVRANTIENSPMYSKAKKFMDSKDYEYEVISEKRSLAEAAQRLATDFEGEVKDLPNKANFDGVDLDTAMGIVEQYIKEAEASGDWSKVNQWSKLIQEKGTQGGQLIQAFAKYSRTPEGAVIKGQQTVDAAIRQIAKKNPKLLELTEQEVKDILEALKKKQAPTVKGYQKIADDIRKLSEEGKLTEEAIRELVRKKNGIPVLDDTDIKNIYEAMKQAESYPEGSYLRRAYQAKAEQIISNKVPKEFRDKFRALQRLFMMTNLRTFGRNVWGNIILGVPEHIKDIPGTAIDKLVSLKTGQRTTSFGLGNLRAEAQGFKQGLSEWRQDIKLGVDTSPTRGQLELPRGKTFQDKGIGKALNFLDNILIRGLQLGDRPFYQAAFNSRIEELRKLGITGEEAEKAARLFALERVFQNDSALSKGLQAIRQGMNDMAGGFPLGDLIIPFSQTPANILDKLLDYSPAGLGKALFHLGTTAGKGTFDQKLFVDRLARTFTGAGISLLTYALMKKGLISGDLSDSKDVRNAQTLQGQQAYSIKIGDTWYSFDWAQPIAGIIAGTVDAIKAGADSDDIIQATSEGAVAGIDTVFNQSVLQGLANLMSGYSPTMGIARSLMSSTSQAIPTGMGQIARIIDPIVRETYDPNPVVRQGKKLVARIPFASRTLPAKIDVAGRVVKQSQGRGVGARMWENLLSPGLRRDETHDPVNAELLRLQSQTGNNAVLLNTAPKIFTDDGKKYILTSDEYVTYQKTMGQEAYSKIQKLMNTPEYRRMSDDEKAKAIKDIHEEAIQKARYEFYDNRGLPVTLALDKEYQEKFRSLKGQMTDKRFYAAVTDMKGKSRDIEKVFAAEQRGKVPDKFFETFNISAETVNKARELKQAGITAEQYLTAIEKANTNGNSNVSKAEAMEYLDSTSLDRYKKYVLMKALVPNLKDKNNPYY